MIGFISNNWTEILGVAGFVLSASLAVFAAIKNRCKIRMTISRYQRIKGGHTFYVAIENLSNLPVCVSDIAIVVDDQNYELSRLPNNIETIINRTGGEIDSTRVFESLAMPIQLSGLGGIHGYIVCLNCPQELPKPPTEVTFLLSTNRKTQVRMKCLLDELACRASIL